MYKIITFIPLDEKEKVKSAMFQAGGGHIGNYDLVCFESQGIGQFRPVEGSSPFLGTQGEIARVPEARIEMVCADEVLKEVVEALKHAHPYETPAYDVIQLIDV